MFRFVVEHLGLLKRIPGIPQVFDVLLLLRIAVIHPERLPAMEKVQIHGRSLPGIRLRPHRLGGIGFVRHDHEIARLYGNGLLDVQLGSAERDRWVGSGRALRHHVLPCSPWVSFRICGPEDVPAALELLKTAKVAK